MQSIHESSRAERLEAIVAARRPLARRLESEQTALQNVAHHLHQCRAVRESLIARLGTDELSKRAKESLEKVALESLIAEGEDLVGRVARLRRRFDRQTVNIGVVGGPRQGKSTLLQTISGLGPSAIPTSDGSHCTGTRAVIQHVLDAPTTARVRFFTPNEFFDQIIQSFVRWTDIDGSGLHLAPLPSSVSDLEGPVPTSRGPLSTTAREVYSQLKAYWELYPLYRNLLASDGPVDISESQIRQYLAHHDEADKPLTYWRAVSDLIIRCSFPQRDLARLALVDLPGLGHHNPNDKRLLSSALATDVDFVVFVRMPEPAGAAFQVNDTNLYDFVRASAPSELPLASCSLFIVNHRQHAGDPRGNRRQCEIFASELGRSSVETLGVRIVDCASHDDVSNNVLSFVLDHLVANIDRLDADYSSNVRDAVASYARRLTAELERAQHALGTNSSAPDGEWVLTLQQRFRETWKALNSGLSDLVDTMRAELGEPSSWFAHDAAEILTRCTLADTNTSDVLPSVQEISDKRKSVDSLRIALHHYQSKLRAWLLAQFADLDVSFDQYLEGTKSRVTDVLVTRGGVGKGSAFRCEGSLFLADFGDRLRELGCDDADPLRRAVKDFAGARLSYRGFLQHRVRSQLDRLVPDSSAKWVREDLPDAAAVRSTLTRLYQLTIGDLTSVLKQTAFEPNFVGFALVEEFVDRVLRTDGIEERWYEFYLYERLNIWPDQFHALGARSQLRVDWTRAVSSVRDAMGPLR